jgi:Uma2 family endonuclease
MFPIMSTNALSWEEVCAIPWLRDIPAKVETNRYGKIMMSPASAWHGNFGYEIGKLLDNLLPGGKIISECPIETLDGTRVADVAWISRERFLPQRRQASLPVAPEICVEVLSPSNSREEMIGKMQLYYAAGAREVWLCDEAVRMEFFVQGGAESVPDSVMCPAFPRQLDQD